MTTRKTTLKRHIFSVFALLLLVMLMQPLTAFAADKEYRVDSADFRVSFANNGDANITEIWNVTYTKGSFTRFYKDIYNAFNKLEYIPDIQVQSAQINGTDAVQQYNAERNDGHFFFQKDADKYTIHWYQSAANETVQYQINYVIPGALK